MTRNLQEIQYHADASAITQTLIKWTADSENEDLLRFRDCAVRTIMYTETLRNEVSRLEALGSDLRDSSLQHRVRATEAEKALQDALEEVEKLKAQLKVFVG